MTITGFPRISIKIVEEVLQKNIPADIKKDAAASREWKRARLAEVVTSFAALRPDQAFVHFDAIEPGMINDRNPAAQMNISDVVKNLNDQNQAALKTMGTINRAGRVGVNTASTEARIAAMNADELNGPVADIIRSCFNFWLHLEGVQGYATFRLRRSS